MAMLYFGRDVVEDAGNCAVRRQIDGRWEYRGSKICSVVSTVRKEGCRETELEQLCRWATGNEVRAGASASLAPRVLLPWIDCKMY